uniref:Uncharacterized protein n=1 Tax=Physcomitrium patens TaxID=3218 RepID=A0A2K1L6W7_PHYPA|nr:hypothetical protein PHYPA_000154 [Physcomitrium patens]
MFFQAKVIVVIALFLTFLLFVMKFFMAAELVFVSNFLSSVIMMNVSGMLMLSWKDLQLCSFLLWFATLL